MAVVCKEQNPGGAEPPRVIVSSPFLSSPGAQERRKAWPEIKSRFNTRLTVSFPRTPNSRDGGSSSELSTETGPRILLKMVSSWVFFFLSL